MKSTIVLIGMMGCGKTTLGKKLSERMAKDFIDTDVYIEQQTGKTIPELFQISEAHFREKEAEICKEIANKATNTVISCGGGVVLNEENIESFKKTGWILFIDRPVEHIIQDIETNDRPLLKNGAEKLVQLEKERHHLYKEATDFTIQNTGTIEEALNKIEQQLSSI